MIISEIISFYSLYSKQTKPVIWDKTWSQFYENFKYSAPVNIIVTRSAKCESVKVKCVL